MDTPEAPKAREAYPARWAKWRQALGQIAQSVANVQRAGEPEIGGWLAQIFPIQDFRAGGAMMSVHNSLVSVGDFIHALERSCREDGYSGLADLLSARISREKPDPDHGVPFDRGEDSRIYLETARRAPQSQ